MNECVYQLFNGETQRWDPISEVSAAFLLRHNDDPYFIVRHVLPSHPGVFFEGTDHDGCRRLVRTQPEGEN